MGKIVVIGNADFGLWLLRRETIEGLVAHGHEVHALCPDGSCVEKLKSLGCQVHCTELSRHGTNPLQELKLFLTYLRFFKKVKPTMVFTYSIKPNLYGGLATRLLKIPYVPNITGLGVAMQNDTPLRKVLLKMYKLCLKKSELIFFQNSANLEFFKEQGLVGENYVLLPGSGVNTDRHAFEEYPAQEEKTSFLFVGRLMRDKGVYEYIEAAKQIKEKYPDVIFRMVGDAEADFSEEFKALGAEECIQVYPATDDVHSFMKNASAVVVPSYHEGMSNVSLEAASTGRPVISSKIPGCMEIIDEGVNGYSFEVKNSQALAEAMERFINLPYEERVRMGVAGRKKVEKEFNRETVVNEYIKAAR